MPVRPEAVTLIADVDFTDTDSIDDAMASLPAIVRRQNGTPLTDDEITLMRSANRAEWDAAITYAERITEFHRAKTADMQRIVDLTTPYFADLPDNATTADVLPLMTEAERAEMQELLGRVAPDGQVYIGDGS